jgi:hypothetical protein
MGNSQMEKIKCTARFPNPPKLKDIASKFITNNKISNAIGVTTSRGIILLANNEACLLYETVENPNGQQFGGTERSDIVTSTYNLEGVLRGESIKLEARYTFTQPETGKPTENLERRDTLPYWFVKEAKE